MKEIVIVDGVRTAIGRVGGTMARFRPEEPGAFAIRLWWTKPVSTPP
jgi:acetyl-CoA C-acetyltransferase